MSFKVYVLPDPYRVIVDLPDNEAAAALKEIRKRVPDVPLVADIHFHYKLALMALEAGIEQRAQLARCDRPAADEEDAPSLES